MATFIMVLLLVIFFTNIEALFNIFLGGLALFIVGSASIGLYDWVLSFAQVETAERLSAVCDCSDETIRNQKEIVMTQQQQEEEAYKLRLISEFASLVLAEGSHSVLNEMIRQNKDGWQEMEAYFDMVRQVLRLTMQFYFLINRSMP